jgi:hypothetical protein
MKGGRSDHYAVEVDYPPVRIGLCDKRRVPTLGALRTKLTGHGHMLAVPTGDLGMHSEPPPLLLIARFQAT